MSLKESLRPNYNVSFTFSGWVKHLIALAKPGIIGGNIITAFAGFSFGIKHSFNLTTMFASMIGIALIVGASGVLNNYIDRDIDSLMQRTCNRASLKTPLPVSAVILYACILLFLSCLLFYFFTNTLTLTMAVFGFVVYLGPYTLWLKRRSHWSTLTGSFAGAMPPVIAYCAFTGVLDNIAVLLFLIVTTWQMPHFMAISLYRKNDFKKAGVSTLPQAKGVNYTQYSILCWIVLFIVCLYFLLYTEHITIIFSVVMLLISCGWFAYGLLQKIKNINAERWGRQMFLISLLVIFMVSSLLCIECALQ